MKLKQLITGGALAATVLTLGSAQAERNPNEGVVFCKATISPSGGSESESVSVTLPFTGGRDYTYWNIGNVPAGGVADSWHGEGGPGRFVVENNGRVAAYVYLTSSSVYAGYWKREPWGGMPEYGPGWQLDVDEELFGGNGYSELRPSSSLRRWEKASEEYPDMYCLAFTRDVKAKTPTWHMLDRSYTGEVWYEGDGRDADYVAQCESGDGYIGAYMGRLLAHDFMSFDVKFWAPKGIAEGSNVFLTFKVEAASFPLWEHDADVQ